MFIFFGWGKKTVKDCGEKEVIHCQRCNNARPWVYKKVTTWFTLFFIPVIPYKTIRARICPVCGNYQEMDKEAFNGIVDAGNVQATETSYEGMTETQQNYLKEMQTIKEEQSGGLVREDASDGPVREEEISEEKDE